MEKKWEKNRENFFEIIYLFFFYFPKENSVEDYLVKFGFKIKINFTIDDDEGSNQDCDPECVHDF